MALGLGLGLQNENKVSEAGFSLTDIANLKLWLKYDTGITLDSNSLVEEWEDQSSQGNDARQTQESKRPLYDAGDIKFKWDGTATWLENPTVSFSAFSMFFVIDPDVIDSAGVVGSASNQCIRVHQGGDADRVFIRGVAGDSNQSDLTQDLPTNKFLLSVVRSLDSTTDNVRVFVNTTDVTDTGNDSMIPAPLAINNIGTTTENFVPFDGIFNECAMYSDELTNDQILQVQQDIISRNSIS